MAVNLTKEGGGYIGASLPDNTILHRRDTPFRRIFSPLFRRQFVYLYTGFLRAMLQAREFAHRQIRTGLHNGGLVST